MGVTHCHYIHDRIHNFNHTGKPDPNMARSLGRQLRWKCQPKCYDQHEDPTVFLNPVSGKNYTFENSYYKRVLRKLGVLGIDQQFIFSEDGRQIAKQFADNFEDFRRYFAFTMSRMGSIGVLTGNQGEIRHHCRYTNAEYPKIWSEDLYLDHLSWEDHLVSFGSLELLLFLDWVVYLTSSSPIRIRIVFFNQWTAALFPILQGNAIFTSISMNGHTSIE